MGAAEPMTELPKASAETLCGEPNRGSEGRCRQMVAAGVWPWSLTSERLVRVGLGRTDPGRELRENVVKRLAHDVREHVEAAAVGHAEDDALDAGIRCAVDELLHARNERLRALQPEALRRTVFVGEEVLERVRPGEAVQNDELAALAVGAGGGGLKPLTEPIAAVAVADVHVLVADAAESGGVVRRVRRGRRTRV